MFMNPPAGPLWSNVVQDLSDVYAWHFKLYPLWPPQAQREPIENFTWSLVYIHKFPTPSGPLWSNAWLDYSDGCVWHFKLYPLWPPQAQYEPVQNFTRPLVYVYEFPIQSGPLWSNVVHDLSDGCTWHFKLYPLWPPQAQHEPVQKFTRSLVYVYEFPASSGPIWSNAWLD